MVAFLRNALVIFLLLAFLNESAGQVCGYKYRKRITFDPTQVVGASDLTNYPALISITSDNDLRVVASGGHVENTNGYDIIFTAADGVTVLDHQLEKYTSATGEFIAYVRIPSLSTTLNTYIYMYYGNTSVITNPSAGSTWDANYEGVNHLHGNFNDGSQGGNNGTNNGTTLTTGKIANGAFYDNTTTRYVQVGTVGYNAAQGTIELWGRPASFLATETYFFGHSTQPAYNNRIQIYTMNGNLILGMGNSHNVSGNVATLTANTWYHIALTWTATGSGTGTWIMYLNGTQVDNGNYSGFTTFHSFSDIGNDGNPSQRTEALRGYIDEFRGSSIARSADWIATEYNNQNSPSTFYSISAEPARWIGGTSTNWGTASNWSPAVVPASDADIIITNGTNQPSLDAARQIRSMWIMNSATVNLQTSTLSYRFDITNCGTLSGSTGTLTANSNSTFAQVQYLSGTGSYNLNHLTVNNTHTTSPQLTLMKDVNVSGLLTLTSGIVNTSTTNILALSTTATSSSGSSASFVSGPMSKDGVANFVFPVGKGNKWRRASTSNLTASATFRVEYFNAPYSNTTPVNSPLANVSLVEFWQIDRISGAGNANVTLYWEDAVASGINDCADLTVARWNGVSWDEHTGTAAGTCSGTGAGTVATNSAISNFSPFTFGSRAQGGINPLPVELLDFDAVLNNDKVDLMWVTASEINNDFFTVERSKNGIDFEALMQVDGAGTSSQTLYYNKTDVYPLNGISYYRLVQTDFNGDFTYSNVVAINNINEIHEIGVFPNPVNGTMVNIELNGFNQANVQLGIQDIQGKVYYSSNHFVEADDCVVPLLLDVKLAAGMYIVLVISPNQRFTEKLIVR